MPNKSVHPLPASCKFWPNSIQRAAKEELIFHYLRLLRPTFYQKLCNAKELSFISTLGKSVQYCGRFPVLWRIFSALGIYSVLCCGTYQQNIGGCSVVWANTITTVGGYYQYYGGYSVLWGKPQTLWVLSPQCLWFPSTVVNILHSTE